MIHMDGSIIGFQNSSRVRRESMQRASLLKSVWVHKSLLEESAFIWVSDSEHGE